MAGRKKRSREMIHKTKCRVEPESRMNRREDMRREKKGRGMKQEMREVMSGEQRKENRVRAREERITSFLTFNKHYFKLLIEAAYCPCAEDVLRGPDTIFAGKMWQT